MRSLDDELLFSGDGVFYLWNWKAGGREHASQSDWWLQDNIAYG